MGAKDSPVDHYIAKCAAFAPPILKHLRKLVHQGCPAVQETIKWGFPHFMHHGILCSMAAFKTHCAFGFWKRALLFSDDPAAGQKSEQAMGQFGRISALRDLPPDGVLLKYVKEAARLNDAGIKAPSREKPRKRQPLAIPDYLASALKKNKKAQKVFDQFSYSHRKEYVEWITEAKREDTRTRRLQQALAWMAQGKSRNWKYANC